MIKVLKEHIGSHYLLIKMRLYTLTLLELNIFHNKYWTKSEINELFAIYLECKIINLLSVDFLYFFHRIYVCRKNYVRWY